MTYKVAVTGVGGGSGQGILTSLLMSNRLIDIYPVDVTPISAGLYWPGTMGHTVLPKPEDDMGAWKKWLGYNAIDLLIPGSDYDLAPLAAVRDEWKRDRICEVAVSSETMIRIANDKQATADALERLGIDAPLSWRDADVALISWPANSFPLVVKPRKDAASRGFHIVHDHEELRFYWNRTADPIVQEYLAGDEYTCALFYDIDWNLRAAFAMRRWLYGGNTYRAEVVTAKDNEALYTFLWDTGEKLRQFRPFGPINLQLRIVPGRGAVIFEINARASGSTGIRAHWGYNEADMLIGHILDRQPVTPPKVRKGVTLRHYQDIHLENMTIGLMEHFGDGRYMRDGYQSASISTEQPPGSTPS